MEWAGHARLVEEEERGRWRFERYRVYLVSFFKSCFCFFGVDFGMSVFKGKGEGREEGICAGSFGGDCFANV